MKNRLISYFLVAIMFCSFTACNERVHEEDSDSSTKVVVKRIPVRTDDDEQDIRNPLPLEIIISKTDGVKIPGINEKDIISYEIYDTKGTCVGSFNNGIDFAIALFDMHGVVEIRIVLSRFILVQKIEIHNNSITPILQS